MRAAGIGTSPSPGGVFLHLARDPELVVRVKGRHAQIIRFVKGKPIAEKAAFADAAWPKFSRDPPINRIMR